MTDMERFKLRLQLAADTQDIRMGQTREFLVWKGCFRDPDDGEWHDGHMFVFWYPCTGRVHEVFMGAERGWSSPDYDGIEDYLDHVSA